MTQHQPHKKDNQPAPSRVRDTDQATSPTPDLLDDVSVAQHQIGTMPVQLQPQAFANMARQGMVGNQELSRVAQRLQTPAVQRQQATVQRDESQGATTKEDVQEWVGWHYRVDSQEVEVFSHINTANGPTCGWQLTVDGETVQVTVEPATPLAELQEYQVELTARPDHFTKEYAVNDYIPSEKMVEIKGWVLPTLPKIARFVALRDLCAHGSNWDAGDRPDEYGIQMRNEKVEAEGVFVNGRWWTYVTYTMDIRYPWKNLFGYGLANYWEDGYSWTAKLPVIPAEMTEDDWTQAVKKIFAGQEFTPSEDKGAINEDPSQEKLDEIAGWVREDLPDIGDRIARRDYGHDPKYGKAWVYINDLNVVEETVNHHRQTHITYNIHIEHTRPLRHLFTGRPNYDLRPNTNSELGYQRTAKIPIPPDMLTKENWNLYKETMFYGDDDNYVRQAGDSRSDEEAKEDLTDELAESEHWNSLRGNAASPLKDRVKTKQVMEVWDSIMSRFRQNEQT